MECYELLKELRELRHKMDSWGFNTDEIVAQEEHEWKRIHYLSEGE